MRAGIGLSLVIVFILTIIIVVISIFIFPEWLSSSSTTALFIAVLLGITALLASLKNVTEFIGYLKEEKPSSNSSLSKDQVRVPIKEPTENVLLEYRIAILEGTVEWLLTNGVFVKTIEQSEMEKIHNKAIELVRRRYPEAQIEFKEGRWQR